jgi:starch-binding outer membrane protein SusE/F
MKTYKIYFLSLIGLLGLTACNNDKIISELTRVDASTIDSFPKNEYILQNPGDENPLLFTATWTEPLFYLNGESTPEPIAPIKYTLQIDKAGNNFKSPQILTVTTSLAANIYTKDFNFVLIDSLNATPGEKCNVEIRLLTSYGQNIPKESLSTNKVLLSVAPFKDSDPLQPLYIFGDINSWDNTNTDNMYIMFKNNSDTKNAVYTYTGYLPGNSSFKIIPKEALGTNKAYCFKQDGVFEYVESGTAFFNKTEGYKTITLDLKTMSYSIQDYDISGVTDWGSMGFIGSFCNWANEPQMTRLSAKNRHIWKLNVTLDALSSGSTYAVKFRAEGSWGSRWAAVDPNALPYGKTIFLTGNEPDPNIVLSEGGTYQVTFNDLTGQYVVLNK